MNLAGTPYRSSVKQAGGSYTRIDQVPCLGAEHSLTVQDDALVAGHVAA